MGKGPEGLRFVGAGVLGMANSGPVSAASLCIRRRSEGWDARLEEGVIEYAKDRTEGNSPGEKRSRRAKPMLARVPLGL